MMRSVTFTILSIFVLMVSGCGYTTASLLPPELDSIHVDNFVNKIDPSKEVSDRRSSYSYRPGLEIDITRAVIDRFIFDRRLEIKKEDAATLLLSGDLTDFRQSPLSYGSGDSVEEFRIELVVDVELYDALKGDLLWVENGFMGQTSYTVVGPNSKTETEALKDAVKDLAQRIVERTVEAW